MRYKSLILAAAMSVVLLPSCRKAATEPGEITLSTTTIAFASESLSLLVGGSAANPATVYDAGGTVLNLTVNYSSSDESVAYVDKSNGTVRGLKAGSATITASTSETDTYAAASGTYEVTVSEEDSSMKSVSLSFEKESLRLDVTGKENSQSTYNVATPCDSEGNEISGLTVTYTSGNTGCATVDSSTGLVTAVAAGTATITASTAETVIGRVTYAASTASYSVTVKDSSASDDGGSSEIDPEGSDDDVAYFTEDYKVTVVYSSASASVSFADADGSSVSGIEGLSVSVSGAGVTITNSSDYRIHYVLSGSSSSGYFKLYSERKQEIELSGLTLTGSDGAAINNQSGKRTFVVLTGTNKLADGGSYSSTPTGEDERGVFFSEGQLCFSGSGSLSVTASAADGKGGIFSDDYLHFLGGTVTVTASKGHGIRGKDAVIVSAGNLTISCSADGKKGITTDGFYQQDGGTVSTSTTGSAIYDASAKDMSGAAALKCDGVFNMNGGTLTAKATGAGAKGISADGVGTFSGGSITASASGKNRFYINGSYSDVTSYSDSNKSRYSHSFAKGIKCGGNIVVQEDAYVYAKSSSHEGITTDGTWTQTGGVVIAEAYDDAVNSTASLTVSGGYLRGTSSNNDGIDANSSITISGGVVIGEGATAPECGIDSIENTYCTINGGYVISRGGSLNPFNTTASKAFVQTSVAAGAKIGITSGSTQLVAYQAPSSGGTTTLISAPAMASGGKYKLYTGVSGITLSDSSFERFGTSFTGGTASSSELTASSSAGNSGGGPGGGHGRH